MAGMAFCRAVAALPALVDEGTDFFKSMLEAGMKSRVVKRSIVLGGHKTSVSLEDNFWEGLKEIVGERRTSLTALVGQIDAQREHGNLSSAIRLFVLAHYQGLRNQPSESPRSHNLETSSALRAD
jgi:predicted DNA-binding ribbon-helix-helix protein